MQQRVDQSNELSNLKRVFVLLFIAFGVVSWWWSGWWYPKWHFPKVVVTPTKAVIAQLDGVHYCESLPCKDSTPPFDIHLLALTVTDPPLLCTKVSMYIAMKFIIEFNFKLNKKEFLDLIQQTQKDYFLPLHYEMSKLFKYSDKMGTLHDEVADVSTNAESVYTTLYFTESISNNIQIFEKEITALNLMFQDNCIIFLITTLSPLFSVLTSFVLISHEKSFYLIDACHPNGAYICHVKQFSALTSFLVKMEFPPFIACHNCISQIRIILKG